MLRILIVACAIVAAATAAEARTGRFLSTPEFIRLCTASTNAVERQDCLGYISGVADALDGNALDGIRACLPEAVTRKQLRDIVVEWLQANPQLRRFRAASLVATALAKKFPCRR
ncbi:MAG: hypothetical protein KIT16_04760 [Rhodospirillaceae bacterium]|nr:hypothetical protein [Rhodospirillaceae bacterium]